VKVDPDMAAVPTLWRIFGVNSFTGSNRINVSVCTVEEKRGKLACVTV
jgi:hypothetical protein